MFCLQKFWTSIILMTVQKILMTAEDSDDSVEDSDLCVVPTRKHRRMCNEEALQLSLSSLGAIRSTWVLRDHLGPCLFM